MIKITLYSICSEAIKLTWLEVWGILGFVHRHKFDSYRQKFPENVKKKQILMVFLFSFFKGHLRNWGRKPTTELCLICWQHDARSGWQNLFRPLLFWSCKIQGNVAVVHFIRITILYNNTNDVSSQTEIPKHIDLEATFTPCKSSVYWRLN